MASDLEFGLRLTADGSVFVNNVKLSEEAAKRLADALDGKLEPALKSASEEMRASMTSAVAWGTQIGQIARDAIDHFANWAKQTVANAAALNDLSQIAGSSVEEISKLQNSFKISGAENQLRTMIEHMNSAMRDIGPGAKLAREQLALLGITTRDPVDAINQLALTIERYRDGQDKAEVVQNTFGRGMQSLVPVLHDLTEHQDIAATVTTRQASEAEKLEKQLRELRVRSHELSDVLLDELVPAMNSLLSLTMQGGWKGFVAWLGLTPADQADLGQAITTTEQQIDTLRKTIAGLSADSLSAKINRLISPEDLKTANAQLETLTLRLANLKAQDAGITDQINRMLGAGDNRAPPPKAQGGTATKDSIDPVTRALQGLVEAQQRALESVEHLGNADKVLIELQKDKFAALTSVQQVLARSAVYYATLTDMQRAAAAELDKSGKAQAAAAKEIAAHLQAEIRAWEAIETARSKASEALTKSLGDYAQGNDALKEEIELIGLDNQARERRIALAEGQRAIAYAESQGEWDVAKALREELAVRLQLIDDKFSKQFFADQAKASHDAAVRMGEDLETYIERGFTDGFGRGRSIVDDMLRWLRSAFAGLVLRPILAPITSAIAGQPLAGPTGAISGAASAGSIFSGVSNAVGVFGSSASTLGMFGADFGQLFGQVGFTQALSAALSGAGGLGSVLMAAVPWAALAAITVPIVAGLFDKGPAQRSGTFGSGAGLGPGDPNFRSSSAFGAFGIFNDRWFSEDDQGQAISAFLSNIRTLDNAIANAVGPDTTKRISDALAGVTTDFEAGIEHQATSFGDVMKQRYAVVARTIDEELGKLVDGFEGPGDELARFVTGIVGVYETLQRIDVSSIFGADVSVSDIAALAGAGGDVAATFTHLVDVFTLTNNIATALGRDAATAFGEVGLASKDLREHFIDLLGGMNAAGTAIANYLNVAFTSTERHAMDVATGTATLNRVFGELGIEIPKDWHSLNALIASYQLGDETQQAVAATLITQVVPAFAAVNGSAQDAASTLR